MARYKYSKQEYWQQILRKEKEIMSVLCQANYDNAVNKAKRIVVLSVELAELSVLAELAELA